jgi:protein phosphatase
MVDETANWDHCLQHAALSDVGLRRANNQDSMAVVVAGSQAIWQQRGHLFMVADGMGAHAAGELASKMATDTVALTYPKLLNKPPFEAIVKALQDANAEIHRRGQAALDFKGMGTTSTVLLVLPEGALLAQVGDSRAYRLRGDRFEQMTFDHSLVWEMRAAGQLDDGDIPDYVPKNIITRSLGPNPHVKVDLEGPFPLEEGDTFLLCSDGLSGPVNDQEMGTILRCLPVDEAVRALVDIANLRGGPDNITVVVARITGQQVAQSDGGEMPAVQPAETLQAVHPAIWTLLGVSALAALGAAAMHRWGTALVCLVAAAVFGLVAMVRRYSGSEPPLRFDGRRLGKGPYVASDCRADREFVAHITTTVDQLKEAASDGNWPVDWQRFNSLCERAEGALQSGDHDRAVAEYCRAISFMMAQLKQSRDGDSNVLRS